MAAGPTATPTPMPLDVVNLAFYRTPAGSLWCMGEVSNRRDESLEVVQLRVTLYDASGQRVGERSGFTTVDVVPGPGTAPFTLLWVDAPAGFASYEVAVLGAEPILYWGNRHRELAVEQMAWETAEGMLQIEGVVHNAGQEAATDVEVTVTAYQEDGTVAGVRQVEVEPLDAGERRSFSLSIIPAAPVVRIEAVAWGLKPTSNG